VIEVVQTDEFETWLRKLKDVRGKARIIRRLDRLGDTLILVLWGGDKSTQQTDIDKAHELAEQLHDERKKEGTQ
jgi:putative component of toxin-antitoxin plasmid stabilization module